MKTSKLQNVIFDIAQHQLRRKIMMTIRATVVDGAISDKVTTFKVSATTDLSANDRIIIDTEIMLH